jgi:hypothetical protein
MRQLALVCAVLVLLVGCGGTSTLTEKALQKQLETTQSAAAEGALLAADVADDRTTETFARIHSGELGAQAKSVVGMLREAHAPGFEPDRRKALETAIAVARALDRLHEDPADDRLAARISAELERLTG